MGLDIAVYSNIKEEFNIDEENIEENFFWVNNDFNYNNDIKSDYISAGDCLFSFRAGSYGSYNMWRNTLAKQVYNKSDEEIWEELNNLDIKNYSPFYKIINFSDCEGILGTEVSKELYQQFKEKFIDLYKKDASDEYLFSIGSLEDSNEMTILEFLNSEFPEEKFLLNKKLSYFMKNYISFMFAFYLAAKNKGGVFFM